MSSPVTYVGVRHHSPACARYVQQVIRALRPAWVLVEGPSDVNDQIDGLLADHQLPIAVFSSFTSDDGVVRSWAPLCEYSPEWVALRTGRQVRAQLRFIDLPAWHRALHGRENRYSDADTRYARALDTLSRELSIDTPDALWDHLFEIAEPHDLGQRLDTYFDLLRGDAEADEHDTAREEYMAQWVAAAVARDDGPVVVVTGGFHRAALVRLAGQGGEACWPTVPPAPTDVHGNRATSYLVPYSFRRLDAFTGYQSGMPSPAYYQDVWDVGAQVAADRLVERVASRLRGARQQVSTANLVAARTTTAGLAMLRGHQVPTRGDVLDALASTLVTEALDVPLPWASRGTLRAGTDPVVVEMVAALSGDRVGRLAPGTTLPALVGAAVGAWRDQGLDTVGPVKLELRCDIARSRVCHQARVLGVPRFTWCSGPLLGSDPSAETLDEVWDVDGPLVGGEPAQDVLVALIEAGTYGHDLLAAATAALEERLGQTAPATVLVDAVLIGAQSLTGSLLTRLGACVGHLTNVAETGQMLAVALMLWRYGDQYGVRDSAALEALVDQTAGRLVWLVEGVRGGPGPADPQRLAAVVALRDATRLRTANAPLRAEVVASMGRLANDRAVPPDLRGAGLGVLVSLGEHSTDPVTTLRAMAGPTTAGDWLAGLFAVARDDVADLLLDELDHVLAGYDPHQFLTALPALRGAFAYLPPRERARIAEQLMAVRGLVGSGRAFLRLHTDPAQAAAGAELEERVGRVLVDAGLWEPR
ncbi:MAG: DUF5682 family protein [Micrococcales bacterium]|nr:DUF5682 family protein [Micrococcales bacterium]MCL2666281.1 DUF5682 family protein [Micrococcales bacterium]